MSKGKDNTRQLRERDREGKGVEDSDLRFPASIHAPGTF